MHKAKTMKRVSAIELAEAIERLPNPAHCVNPIFVCEATRPEVNYVAEVSYVEREPINLIQFIKSDDGKSWDILAIAGV